MGKRIKKKMFDMRQRFYFARTLESKTKMCVYFSYKIFTLCYCVSGALLQPRLQSCWVLGLFWRRSLVAPNQEKEGTRIRKKNGQQIQETIMWDEEMIREKSETKTKSVYNCGDNDYSICEAGARQTKWEGVRERHGCPARPSLTAHQHYLQQSHLL